MIVGLLVSGILVAAAQGQAARQAPGRIVTTTRLVAIFSQLEHDLLKGIQQEDHQVLDRLLSDEFQVWTPLPPGEPVPREDWLARFWRHKLQSFRVRQTAVRGLTDDISVASFVLTETVVEGTPKNHDYFIVDVWTKYGDSWRLSDRYESPVSAAATGGTGDKRPTGKD